MKPLDQMSVDELMREAGQVRSVVATHAERLQTIYTLVYAKVRKQTADETTSSYINVASAGKRFAGMVLQAARRTANFDRILAAAKQREAISVREREEAEEAEKRVEAKRGAEQAAEKKRQAARLGEGYPLSSEDDLIQLYGEDY